MKIISRYQGPRGISNELESATVDFTELSRRSVEMGKIGKVLLGTYNVAC